MTTFTAACVQINSSNDMDENLSTLGTMIHRARDMGADFITTPECASMLEVGRENIRAKSFLENEHPALAAFRDWAQSPALLWVLLATYDKIHMFDVELPNGKSLRESRNYRPGSHAVLAILPWCQLGLSICYDLRFPHLYRDLAKSGAEVLVIPSAFMQITGEAHWHVLMRARASETGCFIIAAAQCGHHVAGRLSYGHSVIITPWGEVLSDSGTEVGVSLAKIDVSAVAKARGHIPALEHDRDYEFINLNGDISNAAD